MMTQSQPQSRFIHAGYFAETQILTHIPVVLRQVKDNGLRINLQRWIFLTLDPKDCDHSNHQQDSPQGNPAEYPPNNHFSQRSSQHGIFFQGNPAPSQNTQFNRTRNMLTIPIDLFLEYLVHKPCQPGLDGRKITKPGQDMRRAITN